MLAAAWDPTKHPRAPAGSEHGGEWVRVDASEVQVGDRVLIDDAQEALVEQTGMYAGPAGMTSQRLPGVTVRPVEGGRARVVGVYRLKKQQQPRGGVTAAVLAEPLPNVLSAEQVNERMAAGQRTAAGLESRLARQYESSLRATAKRCAEAYRARTQVLVAATNDQPPQPTVDEVMKAELAAASATARTQATRRKMAAAVAGEILSGFGPEPGLRDLLEPLVRRQAGVQAERLVAGVRDEVANILLDALVEGWSVPETAAHIQSVLTEQAAWRATMLARTDLISLSNGAAQEAATVLGDAGPQYKTWLTAGDERVRETHVDANRQTVGVGEPFSVGESLLQYPGDPAGTDADTINCRCVSIFSDSPAPTLRHTFDDGIVDDVAVLASAALDELLAAAFDPAKHPRHQAGDPHGGEFAIAYAIESSSAMTREQRGEYSERLYAEVSDFPEKNNARGMAQGIANEAISVNRDIHVARDSAGSVVAVASTKPWSEGVNVLNLASRGGGSGASLLRRITEDATAQGQSVVFDATVGAQPVYERMGFVPEPGFSNRYILRPAIRSAAYVEQRHPRNPRGKREGGRWRSLAELQDSHDHVDSGVTEWGDAISVHSIEAHPVGEGHGAAFLRDVIAYSEHTGKPLYLTPAQVGAEGLSSAQLAGWYGRHGFRWQGRKMVREPGFALTAAFDPAKHPHRPAGDAHGGEWASKEGDLLRLWLEGTSPTNAELEAVRVYRDREAFAQLNDALRSGSQDGPILMTTGPFFDLSGTQVSAKQVTQYDLAETVSALDALAASSPGLPKATTLYRGARLPSEGIRAGTRLTDKAFLSTSLSEGVAQRYSEEGRGGYGGGGGESAVFRITASPGQKGILISAYSGDAGNQEFVLPRDTTLIVQSDERIGGRRVVTARIDPGATYTPPTPAYVLRALTESPASANDLAYRSTKEGSTGTGGARANVARVQEEVAASLQELRRAGKVRYDQKEGHWSVVKQS